MLHDKVQKTLKQKETFAVFIICALVIVSCAWYTHSKTTPLKTSGKQLAKKTSVTDAPQLVPPTKWIGKKFILLPKPNMFRRFGYDMYISKNLSASPATIDTTIETTMHHLKYNVFCNKLITVSSAETAKDEYLVSFSVDGMPITIYAKTHKLAIEGIAYLDDLDAAAKQWIGKTVYSRRRFIDTYDSAKGAFGTIKVSIQQKLKVSGVQWGTTPLPPHPVWLLVKTEGTETETGIIPIAQSWINVMSDKIKIGDPWEEDIFEKNPFEIYAWDSLTWQAINSHTIVSGMTKEQVKVSWGPPHSILFDTTKTGCREQWIYGSQLLCFEHDSVTSVGGR